MPEPLLGLLHAFDLDEKGATIKEIDIGPGHFKYIVEATSRVKNPPITVFRGNEEMKGKFTSKEHVSGYMINIVFQPGMSKI